MESLKVPAAVPDRQMSLVFETSKLEGLVARVIRTEGTTF
jgi:hypothetical protein